MNYAKIEAENQAAGWRRPRRIIITFQQEESATLRARALLTSIFGIHLRQLRNDSYGGDSKEADELLEFSKLLSEWHSEAWASASLRLS
jgi:hypothetical protein